MKIFKKSVSIILSLIMLMSVLTVVPFSVSATTCKTHSGKIVTEKASFTKNGSVSEVCQNCGAVMSSSIIHKITDVFFEENQLVYNGKAKKPKLWVLDESGLILTKGIDYSVTYNGDRKNCGKYKANINFKGNYEGSKSLSFQIRPAQTEFNTTTVTSKTSISLKWNKVKKGATGYQIQCSTSKKFKKSATVNTKVKGGNTTSKTISNLKTKTYYVRIRTYNTTNKKTTYSKWSEVVKLSTAKSSYSVKQLLDSEQLNPLKTNDKKLDKLVTKIFKKIHTSKMSTSQKVQACYDYLVENMTYTFAPSYTSPVCYYSSYDDRIVVNAYRALSTNKGVCDNYSAAFVIMCRRLGLDAYVVGGTVSKVGGGRTGHAWAYINLNGTKYTFDPQVQSNNKGNPNYFFGKTYSQTGSTYDLNDGGYGEYTFNDFKYVEYKTATERMSFGTTVSGSNDTISSSTKSADILNVENLFDPPVTTYGNGFVNIDVTVSGGTGKYEIFLVDMNTKKTIYDKVCYGSVSWEVDMRKFKSGTTVFNIYIYDLNAGTISLYDPCSISNIKIKN